eukprot:757132-Hanusia_phi.AAC.1
MTLVKGGACQHGHLDVSCAQRQRSAGQACKERHEDRSLVQLLEEQVRQRTFVRQLILLLEADRCPWQSHFQELSF